jgi:hypothetical protein
MSLRFGFLRATRGLRVAALSLALLFCALPFCASSAHAQDVPVFDPVEELDFDDPESWAMKYFSSASQMTALGAITGRERGSVELGLEGSWVPELSVEERTVGFNGFKEEDLNRTPLIGRVRVTIGVGAKTAVTVGVAPPIELDGVEAALVTLGLERPLWSGRAWSVGARLFAQVGKVEGSLTCTAEDARSPPGSASNAFGCQAPSRDEVELDHHGIELIASVALSEDWSVHFGVAAQEHDLQFQVDALTFDFRDRSLLLSDGATFSITAGATRQLGARFSLSGEAFYTPLDRRQSPLFSDGAPRLLGDQLLNVRGMIRYRLR